MLAVAAADKVAGYAGESTDDGGRRQDGLDDDALRIQPPILLRFTPLSFLQLRISVHQRDPCGVFEVFLLFSQRHVHSTTVRGGEHDSP